MARGDGGKKLFLDWLDGACKSHDRKLDTSDSNLWIAEWLGMGHDQSVSRTIKSGNDNKIIQQQGSELDQMSLCHDSP